MGLLEIRRRMLLSGKPETIYTARLIPSQCTVANSNYVTIADKDNALNNTDNTTYATFTNTGTNTNNQYIYLYGFNFSSVPNNAVIKTLKFKFKARGVQTTTNSSYASRLIYIQNNNSHIVGYFDVLPDTITLMENTSFLSTWSAIVGYGNDFRFRLNVRRNNRSTTSYIYLYGAEIEVTYTL